MNIKDQATGVGVPVAAGAGVAVAGGGEAGFFFDCKLLACSLALACAIIWWCLPLPFAASATILVCKWSVP